MNCLNNDWKSTENAQKQEVQGKQIFDEGAYWSVSDWGKNEAWRWNSQFFSVFKKKPCYECSICKSFSENQLLDIIEIDAASNTGVDNIREIIERAQFAPNQTRYKVYIIDEVHMLSKGAFNALLKILEEPPSHVKFILATTEIHKVPETILSRCQRYDFKSINDEDVRERLLYIAKNEDIEIEEKALPYIIKNAKWGLRNAINLFEQLNIWGKIGYDYIIENLWVTEQDTVEKICKKLVERDSSVIQDYDQLIASGKNIRLFFKDLFYTCKDKIIEALGKGEDISRIREVLEVLDETFTKSKNAFDEQITFLTGILKLLDNQQIPSQIIKEISQKTEIKPQKIEQQKPEKKQEPTTICEWDIHDVFWASESPKRNISQSNSSSFEKEKYIQVLKEKGMKGSVIMSLKWAIFQQNWETIFVKLASSFALKSLEIDKNVSIYADALEWIGLTNSKIQFNF